MKRLVLILVSGLVITTVVLFVTGTPLPLLPGYFAKEVCSCHFITGQDVAYCKENALKFQLPALKFEVDDGKMEVRVSNLFRDGIARYTPGRFGCQLVQ